MGEKILPNSTWNYKPTVKQVRAITKQCLRLHISEPLEENVKSRLEARRLIYDLRRREI